MTELVKSKENTKLAKTSPSRALTDKRSPVYLGSGRSRKCIRPPCMSKVTEYQSVKVINYISLLHLVRYRIKDVQLTDLNFRSDLIPPTNRGLGYA